MTIAFQLPAQIPSERVLVSSQRGGVEVIDNLANEWRSLCDEAPDDQPFYRPEWIRAHCRAFLPDAKILLLTARMNGKLCLVLPLVEEKKYFAGIPVRKLRSPANSHGGRFDGVRRSSESGKVISAAWNFLKESRSWDVLEFRYAPQESTITRLVAEARASGYRTGQIAEKPSPYIPVPSNRELLKQMPPNPKLRSQLRQAKQKLEKQGGLRLIRVATASRDVLNRFYALEASGWKGQQGSAIVSSPKTRQFYDEIAESAARFGYFSLYLLELNGQLLAAHFSLATANTCYSPKVAYDETFKQFAPGHLIVAEILQDCAAQGIQEFDITGSDDDWKMKWTSQTRPVNHHYVFKGAMGNLAHTIRFRLRPAIARRLHRKPANA